MKAVIQRVTRAKVTVKEEVTGSIDRGFMILLGISRDDGREEAELLAKKLCALRICDDENGVMNLSLIDSCRGAGREENELTEVPSMLVVSQFTLYADVRKGNRPSYIDAAPPEQAKPLYEYFTALLRNSGIHVETGIFQADMQVELVNDGPVTILLDSEKAF